MSNGSKGKRTQDKGQMDTRTNGHNDKEIPAQTDRLTLGQINSRRKCTSGQADKME